MNIWIITVGEPLPADGDNVRLYRSGLLFKELTSADHNVTWWTSSVDHSQKKLRTYGDKYYQHGKSKILLLKASPYKKNISLGMVLNHYYLAKHFKDRISNEKVPDIIVCSFPTIELCTVAVQYAKANNIPIMIDVRDLWPDIFLNFAPNWAHVFIKIFLFKMFTDTKYVFQHSSSIIAVSDGYLNWGLEKANRKRSKKGRGIQL
jgi:hypothetical protein